MMDLSTLPCAAVRGVLFGGTLEAAASKLLEFRKSDLDGGFKYVFFHPYLGRWSKLTNIFQMGWNHQLVMEEMNWKGSNIFH